MSPNKARDNERNRENTQVVKIIGERANQYEGRKNRTGWHTQGGRRRRTENEESNPVSLSLFSLSDSGTKGGKRRKNRKKKKVQVKTTYSKIHIVRWSGLILEIKTTNWVPESVLVNKTNRGKGQERSKENLTSGYIFGLIISNDPIKTQVALSELKW